MGVRRPAARTNWSHATPWLNAAALVGGGCCLVWLVLQMLVGDGIPYLGYVNAFGAPIAVVALLCSIVLLACRSYIFGGVALAVMLAILWQGSVPLLPHRAAVPAGATAFRLVSASLRGMNRDVEGAARAVAAKGPQIVSAQEVRDPAKFVAALAKASGGQWFSAVRGNEVIASRWPVVGREGKREPFRADLALPGGVVSVFDIHAPKDYARPEIAQRYVADLLAQIERHPTAIVAGDLNSTPWNEPYRMLARELRDAHAAAGWGPGLTFPTHIRAHGLGFALFRIDQLFVSPELVPLHSHVGSAVPGADHYPLVVDLAFVPAR